MAMLVLAAVTDKLGPYAAVMGGGFLIGVVARPDPVDERAEFRRSDRWRLHHRNRKRHWVRHFFGVPLRHERRERHPNLAVGRDSR